MRRLHVITPGVIHQQARQALSRSFDWKPLHESVSIDQLLDLLLLMAASATSLFATVRRFFFFSHQTASLAVKANLPERQQIDRLTRGLVTALDDVAAFSSKDRRRNWMLAIDTHNVPYYGTPTPDVVGRPKKQGTKQFFCYATAVLLHKRRRYTIALEPVFPKTKPHEIVRRLLNQIVEKRLENPWRDARHRLRQRRHAPVVARAEVGLRGSAAPQPRTQPVLREAEPPRRVARMDHRPNTAPCPNADLSLEGPLQNDPIRLSGLERRPRPQRSRTSEPKSPLVSATLRDRNELPAKKPSAGPHDQPRSDLSTVAGGNRLLAPPSLGDADGNPGAPSARPRQRLDRRTDPPKDG